MTLKFTEKKPEDGKMLDNNIPYKYTEEEKNKMKEIINGSDFNIYSNLKKFKLLLVDFLESNEELLMYFYDNGDNIDFNNIDINVVQDNELKQKIVDLRNKIGPLIDFLKILVKYFQENTKIKEKIIDDVGENKQNSNAIACITSGRIKEGYSILVNQEKINLLELQTLGISEPKLAFKIFNERKELIKEYPDFFNFIKKQIQINKIIELVAAKNGMKKILKSDSYDNMNVFHSINNKMNEIQDFLKEYGYKKQKLDNFTAPDNVEEFRILEKIFLEFLDEYNILALKDDDIENLIKIGGDYLFRDILLKLSENGNLLPRHGEILSILLNKGKLKIK